MTLIRLVRTGVLASLSLALFQAGCRKQPRMATVPPPAVQTVPAVSPAKLPEPPPPQTSPPITDSQTVISTDAVPPPVPAPPDEPQPKKRSHKPAQNAALTASAQAPDQPLGPAIAPPAAEASPKLGQMLSSDEERVYNQDIDRDLQRVRAALKVLNAKPLSDPQKEVVKQIETFLKQAEDLRKTDLVEAKGLTHKADILTRDLQESLQ